jgi:hypothetical protein
LELFVDSVAVLIMRFDLVVVVVVLIVVLTVVVVVVVLMVQVIVLINCVLQMHFLKN